MIRNATLIDIAAMQALHETEDLLDLRCGDDSDAQKIVHAIVDAVTPLIEDAYVRKLEAAEEIARKGNEYTKGWKLLENDGSVTTLGTSDAIEAAERALEEWDSYLYPGMARAVLTAVTPLIEANALERAAKLVACSAVRGGSDLAAAIRALKPASPSPSDASA